MVISVGEKTKCFEASVHVVLFTHPRLQLNVVNVTYRENILTEHMRKSTFKWREFTYWRWWCRH